MKSDDDLRKAGFTDSGSTRYKNSVAHYCEDLFFKSVALGDRDKAADLPREVTHEHVRGAALAIAMKGRNGHSRVQVGCQVGEYICAVLAGVGGGKLDAAWGIWVFGGSLAVGVILFVIRLTQGAPK